MSLLKLKVLFTSFENIILEYYQCNMFLFFHQKNYLNIIKEVFFCLQLLLNLKLKYNLTIIRKGIYV